MGGLLGGWFESRGDEAMPKLSPPPCGPPAEGQARRDRYNKMADEGFLQEDVQSFGVLIERCADLERRANASAEED